MNVLIAGEAQEGSLLRSLEAGLRAEASVTVVDPYRSQPIGSRPTLPTRVRRHLRNRQAGEVLIEATQQLGPDALILVKGRGISAEAIERCRHQTRVLVYYPDNPYWRGQDDGDALARLAAADTAAIWSDRLRERLAPTCRRAVAVPFGFDERAYCLTPPGVRLRRERAVFVGVWSARRDRFIRELEGLPVVVAGGGWREHLPAFGRHPLVSTAAGELLRTSLVGINLLHPQNATAHNMRTREIAASGAVEVTDPGTDGTPLRNNESCAWFETPAELRVVVERLLSDQQRATELAEAGQQLVCGDGYDRRALELLEAIDGTR